MLQKIIIIFSAILGLFSFGYLRGKDKEKTQQLKTKLKNAEENQKVKHELDAISIADKRVFLRNKFPKRQKP